MRINFGKKEGACTKASSRLERTGVRYSRKSRAVSALKKWYKRGVRRDGIVRPATCVTLDERLCQDFAMKEATIAQMRNRCQSLSGMS